MFYDRCVHGLWPIPVFVSHRWNDPENPGADLDFTKSKNLLSYVVACAALQASISLAHAGSPLDALLRCRPFMFPARQVHPGIWRGNIIKISPTSFYCPSPLPSNGEGAGNSTTDKVNPSRQFLGFLSLQVCTGFVAPRYEKQHAEHSGEHRSLLSSNMLRCHKLALVGGSWLLVRKVLASSTGKMALRRLLYLMEQCGRNHFE